MSDLRLENRIRFSAPLSLLLLLVALLSSCGKEKIEDEGDDNGSDENPIYAAQTYKEKAEFQFNVIQEHYLKTGSVFYLENYPIQTNDREVAYFWPVSTFFNATNALISVGLNEYEDDFDLLYQTILTYWDNNSAIEGFLSYPAIYGGGTRFYDDNATIGIDLVEAYERTGDSKYLDLAKKAYVFAISGEDDKCGGGIYWNEDERYSGSANYIKAANTTGFTACLALLLYDNTLNDTYLTDAKRLYSWNVSVLQDPDDNTFWNDIKISSKEINKTKWSYNTGIMLSCAVRLYNATNEQKYLDEAKTIAEAFYDFFTTQSIHVERLLPDNTPWFQTVSFRAFLDYYTIDPDKEDKYINVFINNMDYAWKNARNFKGFFYEDWAGRTIGRIETLLTQACVVEMYARISKFKQEE